MTEIISNPELSDVLGKNAIETVKNKASVENMLGGFQKAIEYVMQKNYKSR
jgi:hypothetical protein